MLRAAWALAGVLGLAPGSGEPPDAGPGSSRADPPSQGPSSGSGEEADDGSSTEAGPTAPATAGPGRLVVGPGRTGVLHVVDAGGQRVATVSLRPEGRTVVEIPPGRYTLRDAQGATVASVEAETDQVHAVDLPEAWQVEPVPSARASGSAGSSAESPAVVTGPLASPDAPPPPEVELVPRRRWARWAAPLLSAVVPGGGQALNGQPGRGLAVFTGTLGLILGTVAVWGARDPAAGATPGDPGPSNAREIVRLGALGGLGAAAGLLYVGQILDAHAQAVDRRPPTPRRRHVIALEVARFSTVGFAPGQPAHDLYSDWSLAIMGQIVPRVTLGISDLGIKLARHRRMVTVQAGARAAYRFFDRGRVWLAAGGGVLLQGTRADAAVTPLVDDPDAPPPSAERALSMVPYAHFDARVFLLDRWSLGLVPRVSLPLWARRYRNGRSLPRYGTTFELGATMGVYF